MAAGVTRIVEVAVLLRDQPFQQEGDTPQVRAFQYIPCYLLISSGLLFMFSNEEQLVMINDAKIDAVSYSLLIYSLAFLVIFFANFLIHVALTAGPGSKTAHGDHGHVPIAQSDEFELGLMSDKEDED